MAIELENSVFYHIPKTGGSWITEILKSMPQTSERTEESLYRPHPLNLRAHHATPRWAKTDKVRFGFVRRPEVWLWSFWNYRIDNNWDDNFVLDRKCRAPKFDEFIENVLREYPEGFVSAIYKEFIGEDREFLDKIGRQESLREDLIEILEDCDEQFDRGIIENKGRSNVSSSYKNPVPLEKEVLDNIVEVEKWTYDNFYKEVN